MNFITCFIPVWGEGAQYFKSYTMSFSKRKDARFWKRRGFLKAGASSAAALVIGQSVSSANLIDSEKNVFSKFLHTPLCEILGIKYPLIQAGMGGVAGPELAASVSEAGGLGIITGTFQQPDELRKRIRRIRQLTNKPFGVNLMLQREMIVPVDIRKIPDEQVQEVQQILNQFRTQLGIPLQQGLTVPVPDLLREEFEIILEENVPVWSIGLGKPTIEQVERCHEKGIKVMAMICTVKDAIEVSETGVDIIIAQGSEAGGHRSTWIKRESKEDACIGTMALVPQVVDAVKQPVIAAGGITDGRGMAAALALGAGAVLIGTRFIATKESMASDLHKQAVLKADSDNTTVTDKLSGAYARVIRNSYTAQYEKANAPVLAPWVQMLAARDIYRAALEKNMPEYYSLWAGQGVGQIKNIPEAAEVVSSIIKEAGESIERMRKYIK